MSMFDRAVTFLHANASMFSTDPDRKRKLEEEALAGRRLEGQFRKAGRDRRREAAAEEAKKKGKRRNNTPAP